MISSTVQQVIQPLESILCQHLGEVTGHTALRLILRSVAHRAARRLPADAVDRAGCDPDADRRIRLAYAQAFGEVSEEIFGTGLASRLRAVQYALEEGLVAG